jgi:phenylacetate-CoA ligase
MRLTRKLQAWVARDIVLGAIFRGGRLNFNSYREGFNKVSTCSEVEVEKIQVEKLRIVLRQAKRSEHYGRQMAECNFNIEGVHSLSDLDRFPMLQKSDLRREGEGAFLTRSPRSKFVSKTAGTSGVPVRIIGDAGTKAAQLARRWACLDSHGIKRGAREARLWGRSENAIKEWFYQLAANRRRFCFTGSESTHEEAELERLRRFQPDFIYGYTSLVLNLTELLKATGKSIPSLKVIVCTAESLHEFQRNVIEKTFGCPVLIEYGCSEVDIIAHTCEAGRLHVIAQDIVLEVIREGPQAVNGISGEAVVTDLTNSLMPIIRYRLGDFLDVSFDRCECGRPGPVIRRVQGRTTDRFLQLPSGRKVHAVVFAHAIESLVSEGLSISRFQVKQVSAQSIEVYLEGAPDLAADKNYKAIEREVTRRLPESMRVAVFFGRIPENPSGKHAYFYALSDKP